MAKGNGVMPSDEDIAVERELPCRLTPDELRMRGDAMADAELDVDRLKDERRALNKKIFAATDERNKLAHVIDAGEEMRPVVCKWIGDYDHNVWNLIRQDSGDQVEQRTMSALDHQGVLPSLDAEPDAVDVDADPRDDDDPGDVTDTDDDAGHDVDDDTDAPAAAPITKKRKATKRKSVTVVKTKSKKSKPRRAYA